MERGTALGVAAGGTPAEVDDGVELGQGVEAAGGLARLLLRRRHDPAREYGARG